MLVGEKSLFMLVKSPSNSATQKGDFLSTFGQVAWGYPEPGSFLAQGRVRGQVFITVHGKPHPVQKIYVFPTRVVCLWYDVVRDFSRMRSKGSRFTLGVWGLRVCSLDVAFASATVRANSVWPCLWEVLQRWFFLEVSDVWLLRFAWQAWHFVTFRRVLQRVESRFAWQAQYFCDVFRRCVAVFVAGAALWACPSSFFVAGAAL